LPADIPLDDDGQIVDHPVVVYKHAFFGSDLSTFMRDLTPPRADNKPPVQSSAPLM